MAARDGVAHTRRGIEFEMDKTPDKSPAACFFLPAPLVEVLSLRPGRARGDRLFCLESPNDKLYRLALYQVRTESDDETETAKDQ